MNDYMPNWVLAPVWSGDTAYHETVLFLSDREYAQLLYPADEILSVVSADHKTKYRRGIDWEMRDGCLRRLPGSAIPAFPIEEYYPPEHKNGASFACTVEGHPWLVFGEGTTFIRWQIDVTYRHREKWSYSVPAGQRNCFLPLHEKLCSGENVNIVFYGDSITTGCNSSILYDISPHMPTFPHMITEQLAETYGYTVQYLREPQKEVIGCPYASDSMPVLHYYNTARGGMDSIWGAAHTEGLVNQYAPDLLILAFGMNDGDKKPEEYIAHTRNIIDQVRAAHPNCCICLVSTILPHFRAKGFYGWQSSFEPHLYALAADYKNMAVAPVTSVHSTLLSRKEYYDMTGNNVNHCNDYLARVYAMTILQTILHDSNDTIS